MPGVNLTRDEAFQRSSVVRADSYEIDLDLSGADDLEQPTFRSTTTLRFTCAEPGAATWLDLIAPTVRSVTLNGVDLDPAQVYDGSRISLAGLASSNEVVVVADAAFMTSGEGLHRFSDPVDDQVYLYSQFEVADARRVFACFDQPDLKATFTIAVTAPAAWNVISCYPAANVSEAADGATTRRWEFETTPRLSTYVTAICAGPYVEVTDRYDGRGGRIDLGLHCRASLLEHLDSDELFTVTKQGFAFFEDAFDYPYPFAKYDQVFVPEFNAGAMENVGCVTYRDEYLFRSRVTDAAYERRAETVLHEMAHMWFGDLVTMTWWDDLWLNESFATWASVLAQSEATRWTESWTTFATTEKLWALRQDQLPTTHPISADAVDLEAVENNFDGITYAKGASVLKQLVAFVGRDAFFRGLRRYFKENAFGNTSMADLFAELEAESGRDLRTWEQAWLTTAGVNTLTPAVEIVDGAVESLVVTQEATEDYPTIRPHRVGIGRYDLTEQGLVRTAVTEVDVDGVTTAVPFLDGQTAPDLVLVNDEDLTFSKIRFDETSLATLVSSIDQFTDSLPRAMCWTAATDMLRDAQIRATDYVTLVLGGVHSLTDLGVLQTVLRSAHGAAMQFSAPAHRPELLQRLAGGLLGHAEAAEAGTDMQLALVRAWVAVAREEDSDRLRGVLEGDHAFQDLSVDTDLRWLVVQRLAALGAAGEDLIAAEESTDDTAAGRRQAAHARAAVPSPQGKAAAWEALLAPGRLSNAVAEATLAGFVQPEQPELMRPYVSRYFAVAADLWDQHTPKSAERLLDGLFPRSAVSQQTLDRAADWVAAHPDRPAVERIVSEGAADVRRAMRAQAADAQAAR